jgi:hypothetical protein
MELYHRACTARRSTHSHIVFSVFVTLEDAWGKNCRSKVSFVELAACLTT